MEPRHTKLDRTLASEWGESVAARRAALGFTQAQLANLLGLTQQSISKIEKGKLLPLDRTKVALSKALGTTPSELFPWPSMKDLVAEMGAAA